MRDLAARRGAKHPDLLSFNVYYRQRKSAPKVSLKRNHQCKTVLFYRLPSQKYLHWRVVRVRGETYKLVVTGKSQGLR